jgi:glycosyltransferase involved in cell wall biosynthesis
MKGKNIIAIPPYYSKTSFEEIVLSLRMATKNLNVEVLFIGASRPLPNRLTDSFLDDFNYIKGQISLIKNLCQIKDARKILFLDYFNPGLDILFYNNQKLNNYKCKYGALLHGTSFFDDDLYFFPWLKYFELSWAQIYNSIYTPSRYITKNLPISIRNKIKILPFGVDSINFISRENYKKKYDVIFPHRLNEDKGITQFIDIIKKMSDVEFFIIVPQKKNFVSKNNFYIKLKKFSNVKFIFSESPDKHLSTLSDAKIVLSCAKQENFGYSVIKSVLCGCIPVLPNKLCYPELFDKRFLYNNTNEAIDLIYKYLNNNQQYVDNYLMKVKNEISKFSFLTLLKDFFEDK